MALAHVAGLLNLRSSLLFEGMTDRHHSHNNVEENIIQIEARADSDDDDNENDNDNTLDIFLSNPDPDFKFAASVVEADCESTVLALRCTEGPDSGTAVVAYTCGPNAEPVTVTEKPDQFYLSTATTTQGIQATIIEDCKLDGTKSASCEVSIAYSYNGQATATSTATVLGGDGSNYRHAVSVTAGADKLAKATGEACSAASSLMMNTRAVVMWGLLGAFGVLALQG